MVNKNIENSKRSKSIKFKNKLEIIGGYIIALGGSYVINLFFGFGDYIEMIIYVSFLYWIVVYFKIASEKKPIKK